LFRSGKRRLLFHLASPLLDPSEDFLEWAIQIDEQVWMREIRSHDHRVEQLRICIVVDWIHRPFIFMHLGEDSRIFVYGTVLDKAPAIFENPLLFLETFRQKIDLQMEAPFFEVIVKTVKIRILIYIFQ